jgi:hypothetical protein
MEAKKPYYSKTLITNLLMAIVAFFPPVEEFVVANPTIFIFLFAAVNMGLRLVSKKEIVFY